MELLDKYVDQLTQYTTDPLITYDWLTEVWVVQLDDTTAAHIYGGNRGKRAEQLADLVRAGKFEEIDYQQD